MGDGFRELDREFAALFLAGVVPGPKTTGIRYMRPEMNQDMSGSL